ncbi:hypothetical protein [Streptomyces sp. NPDC051218]|uniref:hypothetical protein n=1 Tax=Streptomyces sp. NPDC051218 TaxID=3365645 RepID=UPI003789425A
MSNGTKRIFVALSGMLLSLGAVSFTAAPGAAAAASVPAVADAWEKSPVYVDPAASEQLSGADADAIAEKIKDADKPVFVAVLAADFPKQDLFQKLRTETGVTGVYGIRLGDAFDAKADRQVLSNAAVSNLVATYGDVPNTKTQLNDFVDQAVKDTRGSAPASWDAGSDDGTPVGALIGVGAVLVAGGGATYAVVRRNRRRKAEEQRVALEKLRVVVDEDITAYGEELDRLDFHPGEAGADDAMRADYERALDSYEKAKSFMAAAERPEEVRAVTQSLEDGRFSLALLAARREGRPLPEWRAPCFFDPRHGPSVKDAQWAPPGGAERTVPVCLADATRLADGEEPMSRTVATESGERRPYWDAGPAYGPWAGGYFGGGMLPGLLIGTMLGGMMASPAYAADYGAGYGDFGGGAGAGYDGGDYSGSDFDPGDFGGGGFGGGGDFGGGGGDFGGGGF